jgi:hypothetical protein
VNYFILDAWGRSRGQHAGYPTLIDAMDGFREEVDTDPINHLDEYPFSIRNAAGEVQLTYQQPSKVKA